MMRKVCFLVGALVWFSGVGLAQATHIHYEDYGLGGVTLAASGESSFTWEFDLDSDNMSLWDLSSGDDFTLPCDAYGSMSEDDILHYAYLTMKFTQVRDGIDEETIDFELDLSILEDIAIAQGGLPQNAELVNALIELNDFDSIFAGNQGSGNLNVTSYLQEDHYLIVTITAVTGSFVVDKMDLKGCYETTPVPEPATVLLVGVGMLGLTARARMRKIGNRFVK